MAAADVLLWLLSGLLAAAVLGGVVWLLAWTLGRRD
jgi:predicted Co/Zn/Cd cation transporter (cation efflux family)